MFCTLLILYYGLEGKLGEDVVMLLLIVLLLRDI